MKVDVVKISAERWEAQLAASAHVAVFDEILLPEYDRIDFVLLMVNAAQNQPVAYITVRETDAESVYLKHGGAFAPIKGSFHSFSVYIAALKWLRERYKRITTLVENTNAVYLKMALSAGFKVIGIRNFKGAVLVELFLGEET